MLKRSLSGGIYVHPWDITFSLFHPHLKRVSVGAAGDDDEARLASLKSALQDVPDYAEPEIMHNQRSFDSSIGLQKTVRLARDAGIRHHSFHDYGMSRRHELAWIGDCRDAWSEDER